VTVRSDATYLVTGGLRGLGLASAEWLATQGARSIVLMGRSQPAEEAEAAIERLRAQGTVVTAVQGDVAILDDVRRAVDTQRMGLPPLAGVIHSAGVLEDAGLLQQTWTRMQKVLAPKVSGAWHLHQATADVALDFFLLFGSVASITGSRGQANHAAANAFLDAFAAWRRAGGFVATTIAWGPWAEIGVAAADDVQDRTRKQGIGSIQPASGMALLADAIRGKPAHFAVLPIDWNQYMQQNSAATLPALFSDVVRDSLRKRRKTAQRSTSAGSSSAAKRAEVPVLAESSRIEEIQAMPAPKRESAVIDLVRDTAGTVLGLSSHRIDEGAPLNSLGLDSLMAVELRNQLSSRLGDSKGNTRRLPATLVYDYPTVREIARYLLAEILPADASPPDDAAASHSAMANYGATPPAEESASNAVSLLDDIAGLSNEEVERLLADISRGSTS
jgi:polyketide synthase 12/myxalamid-type polyketide synthase MxaB